MPVTLLRSPRRFLLQWAAAAMLTLFCFGASAIDHQAREPRTILLLGDSLSAAYGVPQDQAWTRLLGDALPGNVTLHNASVSGETTSGGLQRLPALLEAVQPDVVIVELGGNDGLRGYPLSSIRNNLIQLISLSEARAAKVLLVGMQIPPNYGKRYALGFAGLYPELADTYSLPLIPFLLDGIATRSELMQADQIHPNAKAQPLIVQNVLPSLLALLD